MDEENSTIGFARLAQRYPTLFGPDATGSKGTRLLNAVRDAFAEEAQSGED